jgi:hypothetical protein
MGRLHLACIAVFPYIAGLRKRIVALQRLRRRVGFLRLSLKFVKCLLGYGWFIHKKSGLYAVKPTSLKRSRGCFSIHFRIRQPRSCLHDHAANRLVLAVEVAVLHVPYFAINGSEGISVQLFDPAQHDPRSCI